MKCDICTGEIDVQANGYGEGHNAFPISNGRCCTKCNDTEVIPMRIAIMQSGRPMPTRAIKDILKEQREARALAKISLKNITKEINDKKN
mgnify:FL=1|jgi:hypothetical protein|tara:strand:- start:300 stop:569 length:270 start_codon:yes stop_codon:yes gene_type:complete